MSFFSNKLVEPVDVLNDFYKERFEFLCEVLERGIRVLICVDCIGHTRAQLVEGNYVYELKKKYGDRLCREVFQGDVVYFLQ